MTKLTDLKIKALKPPQKGQKTYWDDLPGFGIRISQGGTKSFVIMYGRDRRLKTLGKYPIINLIEARTAAKLFLAERTLNPHKTHPSKTYDEATAQYIELRTPALRPKTLIEYERFLKRFSFNSLVEDISTQEVIDQLDRIDSRAEKTHSYTAIKVFFNWCIERQYLQVNPLQRVKKPPIPLARDRTLTDDELTQVWNATHGMARYSLIVRLLILTGQRANQIASLKEEWIDYDKKLIIFPPAIMKNKREHVLPFGSLTHQMLISATPHHGYLFAPQAKTAHPFTAWSKSKTLLDASTTIPPWRIHDLRRTWSTNAPRLEIEHHITERILSHYAARGRIANIYDRHKYLEPMREAIEKMESHILELVSPPLPTHIPPI